MLIKRAGISPLTINKSLIGGDFMKKVLAILLVLVFSVTTILTGCGSKEKSDSGSTGSNDSQSTQDSQASEPEKPDTWIADRHIVVRTFDPDVGLALPDDQVNNEVAQKIKELTGITMEVQYTPADSSKQALTTALAAGDLPDVIHYYLNNSSRPEMPIVLKAAREGLFADVAPYLKETKIYGKYYEEGYLPEDTYKNIIQREEFNGATYIVHMRIPRTETSNDKKMRGGMMIQESIANALGVDLTTIKTQEDLYDLLKKIKEGDFKDVNGNTVYPLGPAIWGGAALNYVLKGYNFGVSDGFGITDDGKILHEVETDYVYKKIEFMQKLLKEGLIHPEVFTMDDTRAEEMCRSNSFGIIADVHNYIDIFEDTMYLPVGPLLDYKGRDREYKSGKSGYCAWSVSAKAKNPEEIVKFADFLASREGKLIWQYGIEGVHYDLVNGNPVPKKEILELLDKDYKEALQLNIWAGGRGSYWGVPLGETDVAPEMDFGEMVYGQSVEPEKFELPLSIYNYGRDKWKPETVFVEGFGVTTYLTEYENNEQLVSLLDTNYYEDILVKAFFAKSFEEGKAIVDNYRDLLIKAGLKGFEEYLEKIYNENPEMLSLSFYK